VIVQEDFEVDHSLGESVGIGKVVEFFKAFVSKPELLRLAFSR
jgi:hypothetical protein